MAAGGLNQTLKELLPEDSRRNRLTPGREVLAGNNALRSAGLGDSPAWITTRTGLISSGGRATKTRCWEPVAIGPMALRTSFSARWGVSGAPRRHGDSA